MSITNVSVSETLHVQDGAGREDQMLAAGKLYLPCKPIAPNQVQSMDKAAPIKYKGPLDVVKQLYREGGIRSIYRGTAATLLRGRFFDIWFIDFTQTLQIFLPLEPIYRYMNS